jgi:two-component system, OmpR family, response regulator QseB
MESHPQVFLSKPQDLYLAHWYASTMHFLLIEDDLDLGPSLQRALKTNGHTSEWLRTARDGRAFATKQSYDCILLDLTLPDGDGMDVLRGWRRAGVVTPIIIITSRNGLNERLAGLDEGADDFLVKPFAISELVARVGAVTRRAAQQAQSTWTIGELVIDIDQRSTVCAGFPVHLSRREFDLLMELARSAGKVVSKSRLAQSLSPMGDPLDFNSLEVHVHNIRRKLNTSALRTVRGVGYMLER